MMGKKDALHVHPGMQWGVWHQIPDTDLEIAVEAADTIGSFWIRKKREERYEDEQDSEAA